MVKIAILGIGTVGSGTADIFEDNGDVICRTVGQPVQVKYILCRRMRPNSRFADRIVLDFETIVSDPEIRVVAECMGGVHPAYDYAAAALRAGKHVVTSNKQLVAECGLELTRLARENHVCFLFEGSVGGGIPVIRPITRCLAANRLESVYGILNGTTNYILTEMIQCGKGFGQALAEAQEKGYAELDPTADVEGIDACRKICILADLCFGYNVDPAQVRTQGISSITSEDVDYARRMGYRIKLLGRSLRLPDGRITAYVAPHFVEKENPLGGVDGVLNGIVIHGNAVGDTVFCGPGAGALQTGSAVAADILDCLTELRINAAKELLAEAGYPDGFDMTIAVSSNYQPHMDTAEVVVQQLAAIGIRATVQPVDATTWYNDVYVGRQFDATITGLDAKNITARAMLERFVSDNGKNFVNYNNPAYDELYAKARACADDAEQTALYQQMETMLTETAANLYLQDMADLVAIHSGLTGYTFYPIYAQDLSTVGWE